MTRIRGQFRKERQEKRSMAREREMVEDAVSEKELERMGKKEKKEFKR